MRLAKLSAFRQLVYLEGTAPSLSTLRERIRAGRIPGGRVEAGHFYVDMDEYERTTGVRDKLRAERAELAGRPRLRGLV